MRATVSTGCDRDADGRGPAPRRKPKGPRVAIGPQPAGLLGASLLGNSPRTPVSRRTRFGNPGRGHLPVDEPGPRLLRVLVTDRRPVAFGSSNSVLFVTGAEQIVRSRRARRQEVLSRVSPTS